MKDCDVAVASEGLRVSDHGVMVSISVVQLL